MDNISLTTTQLIGTIPKLSDVKPIIPEMTGYAQGA